MSRRTFAVLHTFEPSDPEVVIELDRVELRALEIDENLPLLFGGQLYVPAPLHLRRTARPMVRNADQVELPYHLTPVYDVDFDEIAPRLYSPAEADELVERVREPLDQLHGAIEAAGDDLAMVEPAREIIKKAQAAAGAILEQLAPECAEGEGDGSEETPCPNREDGTHCVHWWDGDRPCCSCGDNSGATVDPLNTPGSPAIAEISVLVDNRDADGRWVCTAERPWRAELGRAVHPSAVSDGSGDDYDAWSCPHCKLGFRTTVGD